MTFFKQGNSLSLVFQQYNGYLDLCSTEWNVVVCFPRVLIMAMFYKIGIWPADKCILASLSLVIQHGRWKGVNPVEVRGQGDRKGQHTEGTFGWAPSLSSKVQVTVEECGFCLWSPGHVWVFEGERNTWMGLICYSVQTAAIDSQIVLSGKS